MNVILKVIKLYKTPPLHGFVNFWLELQLVTIYQHYRKEHHKSNEVTLNISDVLKTKKDVALQSYKISLTFVQRSGGEVNIWVKI